VSGATSTHAPSRIGAARYVDTAEGSVYASGVFHLDHHDLAGKVTTRRSARTASARKAVLVGRQVAAGVLRERAGALRRRAVAIAGAPPRAQARAVPIEKRFIRAAGPKGVATLVAEGDSWFDYLWYDVLDMLETEHGFDIESVANAGDRVEDMAYTGNHLPKFKKVLEKMLRRTELPKAILLSGGGNDIAGKEFFMLLDHARSAESGINEDIVRGVIDVRIRNAYIALLTAVTELCVTTTGHTIPIIVHGYDRPVPDGRGFAGGWPFPGPWLRPGFHQKGFLNQNENRATIGRLIDHFNNMIRDVAADKRFPHVRYVDLRGTLPNGANYGDWWGNELHPTKKGFMAVAQKLADAIAKV